MFLLLNLFSKKKILLYFFVLVAKQLILTILKNRASSHQIIIFIHVVYALVGPVIYFFQNLFVNNDCAFGNFFDIVVMKRIEIVKNRVKIELENFMQIVDLKQQKFAIFFDTKYKEFQQTFAKRKRFSDIWVFLTVAKTTF